MGWWQDEGEAIKSQMNNKIVKLYLYCGYMQVGTQIT